LFFGLRGDSRLGCLARAKPGGSKKEAKAEPLHHFYLLRRPHRLERVLQVGDQVVDILDSH